MSRVSSSMAAVPECMRKHFEQDAILAGRFRTISPLNHGSFGMVFMAQDLTTNQLVAVKCLTKNNNTQEDGLALATDDLSEELAIHAKIGTHPNIVNLITSFETDNHTYLIMEFCPNGDLYEAIRAGKGPLQTEHVRDFMLQLISAVEHMHTKGIFHRDIKPENIFLTASGSVKLGDFGLATSSSWTAESGVGSDRYMAPEQFDGGAGYGYSPAAADIWSVGICLLNVLFSRNPFSEPTQHDPLFADFVRDRQSLFDVFPTLSEDAFTVLTHCLTLDCGKRSLKALRESLLKVISFTTDDESLDDFCTGNDVVQTTLNREPLRTPSVTSPQSETGGSFPWAKALQTSPQKHSRQLSVIPDEDELFPEPKKDKYRTDLDAASLSSALDSGIGMSYKSSGDSLPISVPISASLPTGGFRSMASVYTTHMDDFSKSWSELWEEDEEEEQQRISFDSEPSSDDSPTTKPSVDLDLTRSSTPAMDIKPTSRGNTTPRPGFAQLSNVNGHSDSTDSLRRRLSAQVKQLTMSVPAKPSPPLKRNGSSLMDKWAALGSLRRGSAVQVKVEASREKIPAPKSSTQTRQEGVKIRDRAGSWRRNDHSKESFSNDVWSLSKDWRSPQQPQSYMHMAGGLLNSSKSRPQGKTISRASGSHKSRESRRSWSLDQNGDVGDLEWVGGWHDHHL